MGFWNKFKMLKLFLSLVRDPRRTDLIIEGVKVITKAAPPEMVKEFEDHSLSKPAFKQMFDEKYLPKPPAVADLGRYSEGTFGYAVYRHMHGNNLNFDLWPEGMNVDRPVDYLSARAYFDHDLWHALLGYGVEVEDELAIQAFNVVQFRSVVGNILVAGGLLHLLTRDPLRSLAALSKVVEGYNRGQKAQFLLSVKLHEMFDRPLEEVRAFCQVA